MKQCETCKYAHHTVNGPSCLKEELRVGEICPSISVVNPNDDCTFWEKGDWVEDNTDCYLVKFDKNKMCIKCGSADASYCYKKTRGVVDYTSPKEEHIACHCKRCHYQWYMRPLDTDVYYLRDMPEEVRNIIKTHWDCIAIPDLDAIDVVTVNQWFISQCSPVIVDIRP